MKARIEYLWPIVHQRPIPSATISLAFGKGILAERKRLEVDWAVHAALTNKSQTKRAHSEGFLPPHAKALQASMSMSTMCREGSALYNKGAWRV